MNSNKILPGIWIGNMFTAVNPAFFKRNNIGAVVNCTPDVPNKFSKKGVQYHNLKLNDSLKMKDINLMTKLLPAAITFIHKKRDHEKKNILIHCHAGIQRAPTVCAIYLSYYYNIPIKQAIQLIVNKRPQAFFGGKIFNFEKSIKDFAKLHKLK